MDLDYLKNKKDELGMTYEEIANASGVSLSSIQKIFSGQNTKPRSSTLISIERALDEMHEDRNYGKPGVREVSIGNQDFKTIIENKYFYIDKTDFIREWWESGDIVTLITRPRRFGKTLNISMLDYFFSNQHTDSAKLFKTLDIWKYESFRKLQGQYPVIYLRFAAVKGNYYEMARQQIIQEIVDAYGRVEDVIRKCDLSDKDIKFIDSVDYDMSDAIAGRAINFLCGILSKYYKKKVIVLLDEYDTPLQESFVNGFWKEMTTFIRSIFNSTFKTNLHLERAVMTGITRVSKESIFSDLNNLKVASVLTTKYEKAFGFTEEEVKGTLRDYGLYRNFSDVKKWYDGFRIGSVTDIYNPWSITQYLDNKELFEYWANTSSNSMVERLIRESSVDVKEDMESLIKRGSVEGLIDEEIIFANVDRNKSGLFSLLLASGYLTIDKLLGGQGMRTKCELKITNLEVMHMFEDMIRLWFEDSETGYNDFVKALLKNDIKYMNRYMNDVALSTFSSFDTGKKPSRTSEPERFYHGFVLGLIVELADRYIITSNRESGFGRYDICLTPVDKGMPAYVMEFKVYDPDDEKNLKDTVRGALKQIEEKRYDESLLASGIPEENIHHYGFAFEGKRVLIG